MIRWASVSAGVTLQPDPTVDADVPCGRCGYNLRGLKAGGACPECGLPVAVVLGFERARRGRWHLAAGDRYDDWMRRLAWSMLVAVLAAVITCVRPLLAINPTSAWPDGFALVSACVAWTLACWALWSAAA